MLKCNWNVLVLRQSLIGIGIFLFGCKFDMHQIPNNADPAEKRAIDALKPVIENIAWNAAGKVRSLDIAGNAVDNKALVNVGQLLDVEVLGIHGSITDSGLGDIEQLKRLEGLSLSWTPISKCPFREPHFPSVRAARRGSAAG